MSIFEFRQMTTNNDFEFDSQCGNCNHQFNRSEHDGKWIDGIWQVTCPGCEEKLGTQTSWRIIPTLVRFLEQRHDNLSKKNVQ